MVVVVFVDTKMADSGFTNVPLHVSTSNPELPQRVRRNSNSSIASDVSFLPRYESTMNSYHLQVRNWVKLCVNSVKVRLGYLDIVFL